MNQVLLYEASLANRSHPESFLENYFIHIASQDANIHLNLLKPPHRLLATAEIGKNVKLKTVKDQKWKA